MRSLMNIERVTGLEITVKERERESLSNIYARLIAVNPQMLHPQSVTGNELTAT